MNCFTPCNAFPTGETLLAYRYKYGEYSNELPSLLLPIQTSTVRRHQTTHTVSYHHLSLRILSVKKKFHADIFPRPVILWNRHTRLYIPDHYNICLYKSKVNWYLPYMCTSFSSPTQSNAITLYIEQLLGFMKRALVIQRLKK